MEYLLKANGTVKQCFVEDCHRIGQLLYWQKCGADCIQVREYKQLRWLLINDTLQSVVTTDDPSQLHFPHLQHLAKLWQSIPVPQSILELGLGGGAIHNYLRLTYPNCNLISIEKNPDIIHCYTHFFDKKSDSNLRCLDAEIELEREQVYDWIILDLFSKLDVPLFLYKQQFYRKIYKKLSKNGCLFINFLSQHDSQLKQLESILLSTFSIQPTIKHISGYANHIVLLKK
ncbi:SAM-dependent methyltransferase [Pseudoalteromonas porphyrae]|uniref:Fused MFS/spermidine synthase n=1 Tax=Pseudoalteromonas neustonica TaxID=1840331 RepID=A0ABU9U0M6_9GAMM|nr:MULTISPECIES: fused MFS/spermidine synthase [Pseudoalteromonas]KPH92798.1 SAM-dependent methyltransferase [Pseudoalteromonas porphyrae]NMR27282.1 fused MFS/spermidine synthase [Pseudoalteromonas sp. NEC-BIFX-2020_015]NNG44025.1 fused MFS/spermidine synthase [Pseudoalteromonas sp. NEC-BIFX-2020_002]